MSEAETNPPAADTWDGILDALRRRYPGQKDSVLFCVYKLQQNPDLTLRDFRAEAELYGIPMAGRALHSARGLLGLLHEAPKPRAKAVAAEAPARDELAADALPRLARAERRRAREERAAAGGDGSIETQVLAAIRQIQSKAGGESEQLRAAMRQAIAILQRALGD